jgi:hypothetical protein
VHLLLLDIAYNAKVIHDNEFTEVYCPLLKHPKKIGHDQTLYKISFFVGLVGL